MKIFDLHCDALLKLYEGRGKRHFLDDPALDVNFERLQQGDIQVQCFAIFIEPEIKQADKFQAALEQVNYFYDEILAKHPKMKQIREWSDFHKLRSGEIGAMLTLEGVDAIGDDLERLKILYQLGVRSIGLTWNYANLAADGSGEPRGAGLTTFGREIVQFANERHVLTDVSHLSERAFWDVIEIADRPIASHSNSKALHNHPRNLTDAQAKAMFAKNAMIHVVFYPEFISDQQDTRIADLIKHIDHFAGLGGAHLIGFGSDFDGIDRHITNLVHAGQYENLINELLNHYSEVEVRGFAHENFLRTYC